MVELDKAGTNGEYGWSIPGTIRGKRVPKGF